MAPFFSFLVQTAHAATTPKIGPLGNTTSGPEPIQVVNNIYDQAFLILTALAGVLAVLYVLWAGIQYITSGGSPEKAKAARTSVINAVIGVIIVVAAYAIIRVGILIGNDISNKNPLTAVAPSEGGNGGGGGSGGGEGGGGEGSGGGGGGDGGPEIPIDGPLQVTLLKFNATSGAPITEAVTIKVATFDKGKDDFTIDTAGVKTVDANVASTSSFESCTGKKVNFDRNGVLRVKLRPKNAPTPAAPCDITFNEVIESTNPSVPPPSTREVTVMFFTLGGTQINDTSVAINLGAQGKAASNLKGVFTSNATFGVDSNGPFSISAVPPATSEYKICNGSTNEYSATNHILKIRLASTTADNSDNCYAAFEAPEAAAALTIDLQVKDTANSNGLGGAKFSVKNNSNNQYVAKSGTITIDTRGAHDFKLERDGYRTCEERYDFQYSGRFTVWLTPNGSSLPSNSSGGLNGNPLCHYTPLTSTDGMGYFEEPEQDGYELFDNNDADFDPNALFNTITAQKETSKKMSLLNYFGFGTANAAQTISRKIIPVPSFKQKDYNNSYGCKSTIATSGCAPASAAMVINYYGVAITPVHMAELALTNNDPATGRPYRDASDCGNLKGTNWSFMNFVAWKYGLKVQGSNSWQEIINNLLWGRPVIVRGEGEAPFTDSGHFVVLTGYDTKGTSTKKDDVVYLNDPYRGGTHTAYDGWKTKIRIAWAISMYK